MGGLYDDLPAARAEENSRAQEREEAGCAADARAGASPSTDGAGERSRASEGEKTRANGDQKCEPSNARAAWASRAQASALRAAKSRSARDAEERRRDAARRHAAVNARASEAEVTCEVEDGDEGGEGEIRDAYDPRMPNDYERVLAARSARARAARDARAEEALRETLESRRRMIESDPSGARAERLMGFLSESGREARRRRLAMSRGSGTASKVSGAETKKMSAAEKMMEKMGWKKGRGLGKDEQGMTTPLEVRKDSVGATGKIVNARPIFHMPSSLPSGLGSGVNSMDTNVPDQTSAPSGDPTRVLLLRNVVLAGQVDDSLEDDVADECERFGAVVRVLIFEVIEENFAEDEAVRIFVEFVDEAAAARAATQLRDGPFAKRVVKVTYYDVAKFETGDLGPQSGE